MTTQGKVLQVFVDETDQWHGQPLFAAIVEAAKRAGLSGATVVRGSMGFGARSQIHSQHIVRLAEDLPVVIWIVDRAELVDAFLPVLSPMVEEGVWATWPAEIDLHRKASRKA